MENHSGELQPAWRLIDLPQIRDESGNLSFVEGLVQIPFKFNRIIYVYDIPEGKKRAQHAHREIDEFLIVVKGGFNVILDNGNVVESIKMSAPRTGLFIPKLVWITLENFEQGSVFILLTSGRFEESEYIRDYEEFINIVNSTP